MESPRISSTDLIYNSVAVVPLECNKRYFFKLYKHDITHYSHRKIKTTT